MIDVFRIGVSIGLENDISPVIRVIQRDLQGLGGVIDRTVARFEAMRRASRAAFDGTGVNWMPKPSGESAHEPGGRQMAMVAAAVAAARVAGNAAAGARPAPVPSVARYVHSEFSRAISMLAHPRSSTVPSDFSTTRPVGSPATLDLSLVAKLVRAAANVDGRDKWQPATGAFARDGATQRGVLAASDPWRSAGLATRTAGSAFPAPATAAGAENRRLAPLTSRSVLPTENLGAEGRRITSLTSRSVFPAESLLSRMTRTHAADEDDVPATARRGPPDTSAHHGPLAGTPWPLGRELRTTLRELQTANGPGEELHTRSTTDMASHPSVTTFRVHVTNADEVGFAAAEAMTRGLRVSAAMSPSLPSPATMPWAPGLTPGIP